MLPTLRHYSFIVDVFDFTGNIVAKECLKVTLWTVAVTSLWTTEKTCYNSIVQLEEKGTNIFIIKFVNFLLLIASTVRDCAVVKNSERLSL